jgi:hypothetical protein
MGAGATGTRGTPGAALRRKVGAGATTTRGGPGAALNWEVGVRAMGTHGAPGAALSREPVLLHHAPLRARSGRGGTCHAPR